MSDSDLFWLDVLDGVIKELTRKDVSKYVGVYAPFHIGRLAIEEDYKELGKFVGEILELVSKPRSS